MSKVDKEETKETVFFGKEESRDRNHDKAKKECFTPSQLDQNLCYGGYSWCDTCSQYIHKGYLDGRRASK